MFENFQEHFYRTAGKGMDALYKQLDRAGYFSPERIAKQEAEKERLHKFQQEHPIQWLSLYLGKHAVKAITKPIGGDLLGELWTKIRK